MGAYEESKARLAQDLINRRRAATASAPVETQPVSFAPQVDMSAPETPLARRVIADPLVGLARGTAVGIPETVTGLADIVTGGQAGKVLEDVTGRTFGEGREYFNSLLSPETQAAQQKVAATKGFVPTLKAAISNPSSIVQSIADSVPSAVAGGLAGRGLRAVAKGLPAWAAAGAEEGVVTAGQNVEQVRQESPSRTLTGEQIATNVASAALTGGIGAVSGKLANKLGLETFDTLMVGGGAAPSKTSARSALKSLGGGALVEGVMQELPQSTQEQIAQNVSLGKPWDEGIGNAAAMGLVTGAAMGAGANVPAIASSKVREVLASKLDKLEQDRKDRAESGSATPLADALIAELDGSSRNDPSMLPSTVPEAPIIDLTDEYHDPIQDSENFTGEHAADLLARRKQNEAASQASFDSTNPVVPNAPDTTPVGNPYAGLAPVPAAPFEASGLDPKTTPADETITTSPYAAMTGAERTAEIARRRTADNAGWLSAYSAAQTELGGSANAKATLVRALELHDAAANSQVEGYSVHEDSIDHTFSIRNDTTGGFVELGLATREAATQAAQEHQQYGTSGRTPSDNVNNYLPAPTPAKAYAQFESTVDSETAPPPEVIEAAYSHYADNITGTRDPRFILAQEVRADMTAEGRNPDDNRTEFERRVLERYIRGQQSSAAPAAAPAPSTPATTTPPVDTSWAGRNSTLSQAEIDQALAFPDAEYDAMREQIVEEGVANGVARLSTGDPAVVREASRRMLEAGSAAPAQQYATNPNLPQAAYEPVDRYSPMSFQELQAEHLERQRTDSRGYSDAYDFAWDAAPAHPLSGEITRQALRQHDFMLANPAVMDVPTWSTDNSPLSLEEAGAYDDLQNTPEMSDEWRRLKTYVETQLTDAGLNPATPDIHTAAVRQMLFLFRSSNQEYIPNSNLMIQRLTNGEYSVIENGVVVAERIGTHAAALNLAQATNQTPSGPQDAYDAMNAAEVSVQARRRETDDPAGWAATHPGLANSATASDVNRAHLRAHDLYAATNTRRAPAAPVRDVTGLSQAEDDAPHSVADVVFGAPGHATHEAFVEWVYGDNMNQPNVRNGVDEIYTGSLRDRISRAQGWPASEHRTRLLELLNEMQAEGYSSLSMAHTGQTPVRPTPPAPPRTYPSEIVDIVTAPLSAEQVAEATEIKNLGNRIGMALATGAGNFRAATRALWKNAFEGVYTSVANKVDRFRYGTSTATTVQGIVDDLNAYQASIGSDMEIQATDNGSSIDVKVRHTRGHNQWFEAVYSGSGGSGATSGYDYTNTRAGREAGDGGYGYYLVHLVSKNMGRNFRSGGMYPINQIRRLEHAFSFLARYGADAGSNILISASASSGEYQIMQGESPMAATALRSYKRLMDTYPDLIKYRFRFSDGTVRTASGRIVPVSAIVGHARTPNTRSTVDEPMRHVGYSHSNDGAYSESTVLRALITQEVLRTSTAASKPSVTKLRAITTGIGANSGFTDLIFYNRTEGVKPKSELQAPKLQKAITEITKALEGLIPVEVVQTMAHLPGYHEGMPAFNAAYMDGAIYVVADQVQSVAEAKALVLDHELRHAGLRQVLGKRGLDTFLKQAWYAKTDEIKAFAGRKGMNTSTVEGYLEATEEYIVSLAQEAKNHPLLDRVIAKIRSILRSVGIDLDLSRAELRAMVARAAVLKQTVGPDGVTRFSRTPSVGVTEESSPALTQVAAATRTINAKAKTLGTQLRKGADWVTQKLMPIDRLIDYAMLRPEYGVIKKLLPQYLRLQHEMQAVQDQIVGDAYKRYEKYEKVASTKAERDNFNSILRDGTLWGIFPEGGKLTWTNAEWGVHPTGAESTWSATDKTKWEATQAYKTGLTLHQAFTSLNDRYIQMTADQKTQYHAAVNDMEKLRTRYQKSMQDFIIKITPATTADNATGWKTATGKNITVTLDELSGYYEVRSADGRLIKSSMEHTEAVQGLVPQGKREKLLDRINQKFKDIKGPYAPLSRFGDIVVQVYERGTEPDADGNVAEDRVARYHFENEVDAQAFLRETRSDPNLKATIEETPQSTSMRAQVPTEFMTEIDAAVERLGLDEDMAATLRDDFGRIWLSLTPESSALKHTMKRSGLKGFDEDMMRGYVAYSQRHARGIAYLDIGVPLRETVKDMRSTIADSTMNELDAREAKRLVDHLENHDRVVRGEKISDLTQTLTRFPFLWYLSSPSVFLVQSSQPFIMSLPKLAVKFGYGKALAAITRAYAKQSNLKNPAYSNDRIDKWSATAELIVNRQIEGLETDSLVKDLDHGEKILLGLALATKRGAIDITLSHEAMNILKGNVKGFGDKLTEKAAFLMQLSELMSRKAVFAATFEMEMERHGNFDKAVENSIEVVRDTLYDYSRSNRPGFMLGNAGRILFQFQIFRVHTLSKLFQLVIQSATGENKRAAQKELAIMLGNTMLAAGVTGLPALAPTMAALGFLFGDPDEPWDFEVYMRSLLGDGVVGDALLKGAPAMFDMDVSRRVGMNGITDLFSGDPPAGVKGVQLYSYYAGKALGPLGGVASDALFKAPEMVKQGMWMELLQQTTPKPIKDLSRTFEAAFGEGYYTGKGKLLVDSKDLGMWDLVLAAVGLNPLKFSNAQEKNFNVQNMSAEITDRRGNLQKQLQRAAMGQDPDDIAKASDAIAAFNTKMPEFAITKQQIVSGIRRAMRKEMGLEDKSATKVAAHYKIGQ